MWKAAKTSTLVLLAACLSWAPAVHSFYSYDNDFIPPQYFLSKNWSNTTLEAQQTILAWAEETAAKGPWSESLRRGVGDLGSADAGPHGHLGTCY